MKRKDKIKKLKKTDSSYRKGRIWTKLIVVLALLLIAAMQAYIERGYDLFLTRVADGRGMTKEAVNEIAQGRIWTGQQALGIGLVDQLGTLNDAVAYAAEMAQVADYAVKDYPAQQDFVTRLLDATKENYMEREVRSLLGENYQVIQLMKQLEGGNYLQARIPFMPNVR